MSTGAAILPCCCDTDAPPCTAVPFESAPDQVIVSVNYTYQWFTDWWGIVETRVPTYVPQVPDGMGGFECEFGGTPCASGLCWGSHCTNFEAVKLATYSASLTVQASGVIDKTMSSAWSQQPVATLYRGQLEFTYDFASDHPGTSGASGIVTPASYAWPGNLNNADGMLCEINCDSRSNAVSRGLCNPYSGPIAADDPDSVIAGGPHLGLAIRIPNSLTTTQAGEMPPATDPFSNTDSTTWPPFAPDGWAWSGTGIFDVWPGRVVGFQKLQPFQHVFAKQSAPILGDYIAARTSSAGGVVAPGGTLQWPITRSERGCIDQKDQCNFPPEFHWNSACALDPDRGPRVGRQMLCLDKDCDGTVVYHAGTIGLCNPVAQTPCAICQMENGTRLVASTMFQEQCQLERFLFESFTRAIQKFARGHLASYSATVST